METGQCIALANDASLPEATRWAVGTAVNASAVLTRLSQLASGIDDSQEKRRKARIKSMGGYVKPSVVKTNHLSSSRIAFRIWRFASPTVKLASGLSCSEDFWGPPIDIQRFFL